MQSRVFRLGDLVVFSKTKHSVRPGRRARDIDPAPHGEEYTYQVDKYWIVSNVRNDNVLILATRRGKLNEVPADHPNLRRAAWWERLLYRHRFPDVVPVTLTDS